MLNLALLAPHADIFTLQGVYPAFKPSTFPAVPGLEGAR